MSHHQTIAAVNRLTVFATFGRAFRVVPENHAYHWRKVAGVCCRLR